MMMAALSAVLLALAATSAVALQPRLGAFRSRPIRCSADADDFAATAADVDVSLAAEQVQALLDKEAALNAKLNAMYASPESDETYLNTRASLLGTMDSSELLDMDEAAGFWPADLEPGDSTAQQMVFVDEITCTGCTWCAAVARSTFRMDDSYGKARAYQQGEDVYEAIEEAIDVCPAACIHWVSRKELSTLEEHRGMHLESMQAEGNRYGADASNGHWRDPINSDGQAHAQHSPAVKRWRHSTAQARSEEMAAQHSTGPQ